MAVAGAITDKQSHTPTLAQTHNTSNSSACCREALDAGAAQHLRAALQAARQALPIWTARQQLVAEVRRCSTLVLVGETGSGKTTQLPQFLLAAGLAQVLCCSASLHACTAAKLPIWTHGDPTFWLQGGTCAPKQGTAPAATVFCWWPALLRRRAALFPCVLSLPNLCVTVCGRLCLLTAYTQRHAITLCCASVAGLKNAAVATPKVNKVTHLAQALLPAGVTHAVGSLLLP